MKKKFTAILLFSWISILLASCNLMLLQNNTPVKVADITITGSSQVGVGNTILLEASISPSDAADTGIDWITGDSSIATVNSSGLVTPLSEGPVTIIAMAIDGSGVSDSHDLIVSDSLISVTGVTISGATAVNLNASIDLSADLIPNNASNMNISWLSLNPGTVSVDSNGTVTGMAAGTGTIRVVTEDGNHSDTHDVTVSGIPVSSALIIDHTAIARFDLIPAGYREEAKERLMILAGESHGRSYGYGLSLLQIEDSRYSVSTNWSGTAESFRDDALRWNQAYLNGTYWTTSLGEDNFFTNSTGRSRILQGLQTIDSNYSGTVFFGFGWCWDMTWANSLTTDDPEFGAGWAGSSDGGPEGNRAWGLNSADQAITGNSVSMDTYLQAVETYNSGAPGVTTVFTTGPVDGYHNNEYGYQRNLKHEYIRDYVSDNGGILFDFADILSWDYDTDSAISESWNGHTWDGANQDLATGGDGYNGGAGGCHISADGCVLIAKAMWVMAAMDAGWDGN